MDRGARRTKTDIIDVEMLLRTLMAWPRGEPRVCSMVPIPTEADEEARRAYREQEDVTGASGGGPDRLGDLQPGRDAVFAPAAHSRPELLPQAGLRASRSRSGPALSLQVLPRGL